MIEPIKKYRTIRLILVCHLAMFITSSMPVWAQSKQSEQTQQSEQSEQTAQSLHYDFESDYVKVRLDKDLNETSALTVDDDGQIWTLQDERGQVYLLDHDSGEIVQRYIFDGKGDFEGLEAVGDHLFALRSDGRLYRMNRRKPAEKTTDHIKLDLPRGCDAEGLAWHNDIERFLVVCKESDGVAGSKGRAIYAFKLNGERDGQEPYFYISEDDLKAIEYPHQFESFKPSALTVDPETGAHFMLSSPKPGVFIWTREGATFTDLELPDMRQPEGIAFDHDGHLLITSEAQGGRSHMYLITLRTNLPEQK
jgi:uncharacterized protein YjiK